MIYDSSATSQSASGGASARSTKRTAAAAIGLAPTCCTAFCTQTHKPNTPNATRICCALNRRNAREREREQSFTDESASVSATSRTGGCTAASVVVDDDFETPLPRAPLPSRCSTRYTQLHERRVRFRKQQIIIEINKSIGRSSPGGVRATDESSGVGVVQRAARPRSTAIATQHASHCNVNVSSMVRKVFHKTFENRLAVTDQSHQTIE